MDSTELDDTDLPEGEQGDLPKKLRSEIKARDKALAEEKERSAAIEAELKQFRRDKVFEEVGIPSEGAGQLLRELYANSDEVTAEELREKAIAVGVLSGPAPEAGAGEIAAHGVINSAAGSAPPAEPDLISKMENAKSPEELMRIIAEANERGITV